MNDREKIRELFRIYADKMAFSEKCRERENRFRDLNSLKIVRPPVLIFEIPWGEIRSEELVCTNESYSGLEYTLRERLFLWRNYQGDHTVPAFWNISAHVHNSGYGLYSKERQIPSVTGAYIASHEYEDQLKTEEDIEKIKFPKITYNKEGTDAEIEFMKDLIGDIMPIRKVGIQTGFASWDNILTLHGTSECYEDLCDRPEFIHALMKRMTDIHNYELDEYERLNVLETEIYYLHCSPALCHDMPHKDIDKEKVSLSDVWCRTSAQVLAVVSPQMQSEFDIDYAKTYANRCMYTYYGCCEPLHNKIDELKEIKNLRKISITPWADVDCAAEKIGKDFVLAYKPNPAFVSGKTFDPIPVEKEITKVLEACKRNSTPCEFVLKDISTIANRWENLHEWEKTVNRVIDRYF